MRCHLVTFLTASNSLSLSGRSSCLPAGGRNEAKLRGWAGVGRKKKAFRPTKDLSDLLEFTGHGLGLAPEDLGKPLLRNFGYV
jgi:hypothetical protein